MKYRSSRVYCLLVVRRVLKTLLRPRADSLAGACALQHIWLRLAIGWQSGRRQKRISRGKGTGAATRCRLQSHFRESAAALRAATYDHTQAGSSPGECPLQRLSAQGALLLGHTRRSAWLGIRVPPRRAGGHTRHSEPLYWGWGAGGSSLNTKIFRCQPRPVLRENRSDGHASYSADTTCCELCILYFTHTTCLFV